MHTIVLVVGGAMTVLLAAPALRGGLLRAWTLGAASLVPTFLLYMAFRADGNDRWFLYPVVIMAAIITWKACRRLIGMAAATPVAAINTTAAPAGEHWAAA